ncbi:MAG: CehA/McbA family metallohydrolase [Planctomycetaceae bacterium]
MHHLRQSGMREWSEFGEQPEAATLSLTFQARARAKESTLSLRQQDVKQVWSVTLNGRALGRLPRDENDMLIYLAIPAGMLRDGENQIGVSSTSKQPDDIRVGDLRIYDRSRAAVLSESELDVVVQDAHTRQPLACRITVMNATGALQTLGNASSRSMAVRPGVAYCLGSARLRLPAGKYTVCAGRGFEYSIDQMDVSVKPQATQRLRMTVKRVVPTEGWVACDTHVHTLTHSRHGDATSEERMLTLAGEGIELPIATDHNIQIDHDALARTLGVRRYFTPVIGNEVTTQIGHFNVFPLLADATVPDFRADNWPSIFASIFGAPRARVAILNHARDIHGGFRPFAPQHHLSVTGRNLDGWRLRANGMELVNSGAQQTDMMQLCHDWMGLLNRGLAITPVGCSDSHDVSRHFVGQARTYIRCEDADPGAIDIRQAVDSFLQGRVLVSCGLLVDMRVDEKYGVGDVVPVEGRAVRVTVRVLAPQWSRANVCELYVNGVLSRREKIPVVETARVGVQWEHTWSLTDLRHDVNLVAVARGPGVRDLYWPIAKPYQPVSPDWRPQVIGSTGAVWLDVDRDGRATCAADYGKRLAAAAANDGARAVRLLSPYGPTVAAHVAERLHLSGVDVLHPDFLATARTGTPAAAAGFASYVAAWRDHQRALVDRP